MNIQLKNCKEGIVQDLGVIYTLNRRGSSDQYLQTMMQLTIERAFSWDDTFEGHTFWNGLYYSPSRPIFEKALPVKTIPYERLYYTSTCRIENIFNIIASIALRKQYQ